MELRSLERHAAPGPAPAGLAWDGRRLWLNDFQSGRLYRLRSGQSGAQVEVVCEGTVSGLTWDGQKLWQSRLDRPQIQSLDPLSLETERVLVLPDYHRLTDVAWDGKRLWVVWQAGSALLAVDLETEQVVARLGVPTAVAALAFQRQLLWCTLAHPMHFDQESASFVWSGEERNFALLGIDPDTGQERARHTLPFLPTGLVWQGNDLWLSHAAAGSLFRARWPLDAA